MILPEKFKADINLNIKSIIARVDIGSDIFISTHKMNYQGNYYKPILLSIPSMKESVDVESRNFKISNATLNVSNFEVNGERFSDSIRANPLINKEVVIYFQTETMPTAQNSVEIFRGYVRRLSHNDSTVNIQIEDLTQSRLHKNIPTEYTPNTLAVSSKYRNKPIPMAFGHIDKAPTVIDGGMLIKADSDTSIELVTPAGYGFGTNSDYEGHPIFDDFNDWGNIGVSPLQRFQDDYIIHIPVDTITSIENPENFATSSVGVPQWEESSDHLGGVQILDVIQNNPNIASTTKIVQGIAPIKSTSIKCSPRSSQSLANQNDSNNGWGYKQLFRERVTSTLSDYDSFKYDLSDSQLNGWHPYWSWLESNGNSGAFIYPEDGEYSQFGDSGEGGSPPFTINQSLMRISLAVEPDFDNLGFQEDAQIAINGFVFPKMSSNVADSTNVFYITAYNITPYLRNTLTAGMTVGTASNLMGVYKRISLDEELSSTFPNTEYGTKFKDLFQFLEDEQNVFESNYSGYSEIQDGLINIQHATTPNGTPSGNGYTVHGWFIQVMNDSAFTGDIHLSVGVNLTRSDLVYADKGEFTVGLGGRWGEVDVLRAVDMRSKFDDTYFLNVRGRKENQEIIKNPIAQIRNIAINELNLLDSQIDSISYGKALEIHDNLSFAFSVNKSIESKKLFEDISKFTLSYPYFRNDGKLTFASLKEKYNQQDYDSSHVVKNKDIINFSFNKTKLENVYTKMKFKYNYNYVTEEYEGLVTSDAYIRLNPQELEYNGYQNEDDNLLEVECPYIRDKYSAEKVRQYMFRFHENQHLISKIRLPISYLNIEIGDVIRFDELLGGMKAYGIDYTLVSKAVKQIYYPLFFVTSINKTLEYVEIESEQIHNLTINHQLGDSEDFWNTIGFQESIAGEEEGTNTNNVDPDEDEQIVYNPSEEVGQFGVGIGDEQWVNINASEQPLVLSPVSTQQVRGMQDFWTFRFLDEFTLNDDTGDILLWNRPESWGLTAWNDLLPTDWTMFSGLEIRRYRCILIQFYDYHEDTPIRSAELRNISNSQEYSDVDLRWVFSDSPEYSSFNYNGGPGVPSSKIIEDNKPLFNMEPYSPVGVTKNEKRIRVKLGDEFVKSHQNNLLNFSNPINFWINKDAKLSSGYDFIGDWNRDRTINILDIVGIANCILDPNCSSSGSDPINYVGDITQDGSMNILDIVFLANYILGD